jgi:RNA polymerase sigma-70 factor (ECF subfamily)
MNPEKIETLIEQSRLRNTVAFGQLVETFQPMVFRLAFRMLADEHDAKDIVQETFIRVWIHLHRYKNHTRFSTWIYKIACNLCYDHIRAMKRLPDMHVAPSDLNTIVADDDIEQSLINRDLAKLIVSITNNLTPKQRLVFTLRDIEALELAEVREITGMSLEKIKSNLYLARQYIRKKISS